MKITCELLKERHDSIFLTDKHKTIKEKEVLKEFNLCKKAYKQAEKIKDYLLMGVSKGYGVLWGHKYKQMTNKLIRF